MKTDEKIEAAARYLVALRHGGQRGARIPAACRPDSIDAALAIQQRVISLLGATVGGWKCALPSPGKIVAAPIQAAAIVTDSPCRMPAIDGLAPVEPEIAFTMGAGLPPRATPYTADEVRAAIATTHLAFELIGTRYAEDADTDFPEKLADGMSNTGLFVGPAITVGDEAALAAFPLSLSGPDGVIEQWEGTHPDGHPLHPLCWLANFLNSKGSGLKKGDVVTTGSFHGLIMAPMSVPLTMRFGELGSVNIEIRPIA